MSTVNAIGRRKASIARVYLTPGKGNITINEKDYKDYLPVFHLRQKIDSPLKLVEKEKDFDVKVVVSGGGQLGQAEAIKLGVARALIQIDPEWRSALKKENMLMRDARKVERKKPGLRKARKRDQFSKR